MGEREGGRGGGGERESETPLREKLIADRREGEREGARGRNQRVGEKEGERGRKRKTGTSGGKSQGALVEEQRERERVREREREKE